MAVSVVDPVSDAIDHTTRLLFRPFDLKTWFVMGFCAWLSYLGEGGGGNAFNWINDDTAGMPGTRELPAWFWVGIAVMAVFLLALIGVVLWVSSRGKFMFVDNIVTGEAKVAEPWGEFRREGNALFGLRVLLTIVVLVAIGAPIATAAALTWGDTDPGAGFGIIWVIAIVVVVALALLFVLVQLVINDFVVPLMYLRRCSVGTAWSEAMGMINAHLGSVVLFILVKFLLGLAVAAVAIVAVICTCCLAALPYIGTVILLPVFVFTRSYPLFFLGRFGPEYARFRTMGPDVDAVARTFE